MKKWKLLCGVGALAWACKAGKDDDTGETSGWSDRSVYGFANLDDDDGDGEQDFGQDVDDDNDWFPVVLESELFERDGADRLWMQLRGNTGKIRLVHDGDEVLSLENNTWEQDVTSDDVDMEVEFKTLGARGWLDVELRDEDDEVMESMRIDLVSAPLILNHHLQPIEKVYAMEAGGSGGNLAFVNGFADVLGDAFESFRLSRYGWDVWIQDEIELSTLTAPDGRRMDVVIDSIRSSSNQFLGKLPADEFEGPDVAVKTWGSGAPTSQDSFGNLEVSPPVEVDGVWYPFGRAYYGRWNRDEMHEDMVELLEEQRVQDPFEVDVSFLCVGHVDEFTTFVPDPTSPKGFRFVVVDVPLAYEFLEGLPSNSRLPQYIDDHGFSSVEQMAQDRALRALNEEIQADYIDPAVEQFKVELGLTEDDIVRIPGLFEEVRGCAGSTVALIPGTANMTVAPMVDGETHLFVPDPFLRPTGASQSEDPFIAEIERLLPAGLTFHWLDDWDYYHVMLGEVHCGSNARRTPIDNWWEVATHLLIDDEE